MASPSTVITMGYGSFGSVNLIPTLGFGSGVVVVPRTIYRPLAAALPPIYRPGTVAPPLAYRPQNTSTPDQ